MPLSLSAFYRPKSRLLNANLHPVTASTAQLDYSKKTKRQSVEMDGVVSLFEVHSFPDEAKAKQFFQEQKDRFIPRVTALARSRTRQAKANTVVEVNDDQRFIVNKPTFHSSFAAQSGLPIEPRSRLEGNLHGRRVSLLETDFDANQSSAGTALFQFRAQVEGKSLIEQEPFIKGLSKEALKQLMRCAASLKDTLAVANAILKGNKTPTLPERNFLIGLAPIIKRSRPSARPSSPDEREEYSSDELAQIIRNATANKIAARMVNKINAGEKPALEEYGQLEGGVIEPATLVRMIKAHQ